MKKFNQKLKMKFQILLIFVLLVMLDSMTRASTENNKAFDMELLELLGLPERQENLATNMPSSSNAASRFLREVYSEISDNDDEDYQVDRKERRKRAALRDDNFITNFDRSEIEKCNNLISFSSIASKKTTTTKTTKYSNLQFNMNDIPNDLQLVHSSLRVYHDPKNIDGDGDGDGKSRKKNVTVSVYEKLNFQFGNRNPFTKYRLVTSLNMTMQYKGWLDFNVTRLLSRWLKFRKYSSIVNGSELVIDATYIHHSKAREEYVNLGLVQPNSSNHSSERDPFIVGYFIGPPLIEKLKRLRTKREVINRRRRPISSALHLQLAYQIPKSCERLNFTVNFRDTHMDSWVIAPKKFEAYFCGGECNFPLGAQMNASNHAIVQTLMQLKQQHLPKPCCAPTALESITILHYLNEDNVNLVKFPQSVVKSCGCL